jgi:Domain of unknown function (DUF4166)
VDYLGTHQHLAVDIDVSVAANGGLRLRSGAQRFYEGGVAFNFPLLLSGVADVCEWYEEQEKCFRITVNATNRTWGRLFGYSGKFELDWKPVTPGAVPKDLLPYRTEARE